MLVNFDTLPDKSRLWIYASEKKITVNQQRYIIDVISDHLNVWKAHQLPLTSGVTVLEDYFIVIALDERQVAASGCSIDTLQKKVQQLEDTLSISLMNRMNVFCVIKNIIQCLNIDNIGKDISKDTLFYDLTIQTKGEIRTWLKPIKDGWCNKFLQ